MKPKIIIVDNDDKIIGYKERGTLDRKDIYRVSALWVTNSKGQILLARRHRNKLHHPNMWGPSVAGTVDEGETYEENIVKEAKEELGVVDVKFNKGPKRLVTGDYLHFTQWYTVILDWDLDKFTIQKDEVEEIKWFDKDELLKGLKEKPEEFLPNMKVYVKVFNFV
ncbi:MAG: NUDIX domain-containing protein [archaeon]|nr:NUDIX domain-containing protein [Nanoarchaeota archaeon]